jgi:hypothetical protein
MLVAACIGGEPVPPASQTGKNLGTFTINENTQVQVEKLRIGVANIWEREYTDDGQVKKGLTAVLAISYRDDDAKSGNHVVFPGKTVTVGEYRILVKAVDQDEKKHGWTVLEIVRKD